MCQAGPGDGSGEAVLRRGGDSSQKPRDPEGRLCLLRNAPPTDSGRRLSEQEVWGAAGRGLGGPQTDPGPRPPQTLCSPPQAPPSFLMPGVHPTFPSCPSPL